MNSPENSKILTISGDIAVSCPASLKLMTPYILTEQHDWFEDEIKFLRTLIKPGMKVIDIGANYGLYTLTFGKIIGDSGKVWAFEPCSTTFSHLHESVSINKFSNIQLIQAGLSDRIGEAKLYTTPQSELNSLSNDQLSSNTFETIKLLTLDHCAGEFNWADIDFIKLDAEGEEIKIINNGKKFLSANSPLIMYELKHIDAINKPLINTFKDIGYNSYRLIPGQNILMPFDYDDPVDGYLLNLFCCRDDRARLLKEKNIIFTDWAEKSYRPEKAKLLEETLAGLSFGDHLKNSLLNKSGQANGYTTILNTYVLSLSNSISAYDRLCYLMTALKYANKMLADGEQDFGRLCTFARIAFDAGERSMGVKILQNIYNKHFREMNFQINEPVLPASSKYDSINPSADNRKNWLFSSVVEQFIDKHAFSTYFSGRSTLGLFNLLDRLGFMTGDLQKRRNLLQACFPA